MLSENFNKLYKYLISSINYICCLNSEQHNLLEVKIIVKNDHKSIWELNEKIRASEWGAYLNNNFETWIKCNNITNLLKYLNQEQEKQDLYPLFLFGQKHEKYGNNIVGIWHEENKTYIEGWKNNYWQFSYNGKTIETGIDNVVLKNNNEITIDFINIKAEINNLKFINKINTTVSSSSINL